MDILVHHKGKLVKTIKTKSKTIYHTFDEEEEAGIFTEEEAGLYDTYVQWMISQWPLALQATLYWGLNKRTGMGGGTAENIRAKCNFPVSLRRVKTDMNMDIIDGIPEDYLTKEHFSASETRQLEDWVLRQVDCDRDIRKATFYQGLKESGMNLDRAYEIRQKALTV